MVGGSILLLLAFGALVQGSRNSNANSNTNTFYDRHRHAPSGPLRSGYIDDPVPLEHLPLKLAHENDHKTVLVATAAARTVLAITESLVHDLSESIAISVGETVARVLRQHESVGGGVAHESAATDDIVEPKKEKLSLNGQDGGETDALENKAHHGGDCDNSGVNSNVNTNVNQNVFGRNDDIKIRPNQLENSRRLFWSRKGRTTTTTTPRYMPIRYNHNGSNRGINYPQD